MSAFYKVTPIGHLGKDLEHQTLEGNLQVAKIGQPSKLFNQCFNVSLLQRWYNLHSSQFPNTFLKEEEISRTMFVIEKGCLRTWVNNDGKEITTQFFLKVKAFPLMRVLEQINQVYTVLKV